MIKYCSSLQQHRIFLALLFCLPCLNAHSAILNIDSTNEIAVGIKSAESCEYNREILLVQLMIENNTTDTAFILKNKVDGFLCDLYFNLDNGWPSNKIILYNIPPEKIIPDTFGLINTSPAVFHTNKKYLLKKCYDDFPAKNASLSTVLNKKEYYAILPKGSIVVSSLIGLMNSELLQLKGLSKIDKKKIWASIGVKLEYYTSSNLSVRASYHTISDFLEFNQAIIKTLR